MKSRYSPKIKTQVVKGKKIKRDPKESGSEYILRVNRLKENKSR